MTAQEITTGHRPRVIAIIGPTATGKTKIAVRVARALQGEIVSMDSRQVFRTMDLGTGKDLAEYEEIPYHLIDILDPGEEYSVHQFQIAAHQAIQAILKRGHIPILCGGTIYYLKALIEDYQFESPQTNLEETQQLEQLPREEIYLKLEALGLSQQRDWSQDSKRRMVRAIERASAHKKDSTQPHFRDQYQIAIYYLLPDRQIIRDKIKRRLLQRFEQGMIQEVEQLITMGVTHKRLERYGLEYKYISYFLQKKISNEELQSKLFTEICRFAKRQTTLLRYLNKSGHPLTKVDSAEEILHHFNTALT